MSAALANLRRAEAGEADAWAAADWAPEARLAEALGRAGLEAAPETPLAAIIFAEADFPLLDEPANHLDIASPEAVGAGLAACDGAPLVVSHDEAFQERAGLARRIQLRSGQPTGTENPVRSNDQMIVYGYVEGLQHIDDFTRDVDVGA